MQAHAVVSHAFAKAIPGASVSAALAPYELNVLRSHRFQPRRESEHSERQMAQRNLSRLGYIGMKNGVYSTTPAGKQVIGDVK
jgi:hypothetical protein